MDTLNDMITNDKPTDSNPSDFPLGQNFEFTSDQFKRFKS